MKTKAAIAHAAGRPLEVVTVDLAGPKAGEVLVEIRASGVCHTDEFTRSGADPEGLELGGVGVERAARKAGEVRGETRGRGERPSRIFARPGGGGGGVFRVISGRGCAGVVDRENPRKESLWIRSACQTSHVHFLV